MLRALLKRGDVLVSRSNTADRVGFTGVFNEQREDISFPDTMMRLHVDEQRALPEYVVRALMSPQGRRHMQKVAAGTSASMKKINRKGLGSFEFSLPTLDEQREAVTVTLPTEELVTSALEARERAIELGAALREELLAP
jgi:restriction endonuclease S subunit